MPSNTTAKEAGLQEKLAAAEQKIQKLETALADALKHNQELIAECNRLQSLIAENNPDILEDLMQI